MSLMSFDYISKTYLAPMAFLFLLLLLILLTLFISFKFCYDSRTFKSDLAVGGAINVTRAATTAARATVAVHVSPNRVHSVITIFVTIISLISSFLFFINA